MINLGKRITFLPRIMFLLCVAGLALVLGGCGDDRMPLAPVEGKVIFNGNLLKFGSVMFQPLNGPPARGMIRPDGTFQLSTYADNDGAVIGKHKVRIACYEGQDTNNASQAAGSKAEQSLGRLLIPKKYTNLGTSGIEVTVNEANEPFVFQLHHQQ